jgi:hypothetical protein
VCIRTAKAPNLARSAHGGYRSFAHGKGKSSRQSCGAWQRLAARERGRRTAKTRRMAKGFSAWQRTVTRQRNTYLPCGGDHSVLCSLVWVHVCLFQSRGLIICDDCWFGVLVLCILHEALLGITLPGSSDREERTATRLQLTPMFVVVGRWSNSILNVLTLSKFKCI